MSKESVNSPSHYNQTELECIDAIKYALGEDGFIAYCKGNALKYTWRSGHKNDSAEDLKKAAWYCRMASGDDPRKDPNYERATARGDLQVVEIEPSDFAKRAAKKQENDWDEEQQLVPPECDSREIVRPLTASERREGFTAGDADEERARIINNVR